MTRCLSFEQRRAIAPSPPSPSPVYLKRSNMTKIAQAPDHHRSSKTKELQIAFLICDEPAEKTLKEHGGMDDLLNHLLQPILKTADPDIELVVEGYDVVNKREYPSQAALRDIDCVMISGSFVRPSVLVLLSVVELSKRSKMRMSIHLGYLGWLAMSVFDRQYHDAAHRLTGHLPARCMAINSNHRHLLRSSR